MQTSADGTLTRDGAGVAALHEVEDKSFYKTLWVCEKWGEDKIDFARKELLARGVEHVQDGVQIVPLAGWRDRVASAVVGRDVSQAIVVPRLIPITHGIPSNHLRELGLEADVLEEVAGNLLLNEGIQKMIDLLIGAGGTTFNNATAFLGVGTSATAESATQTELQGTQDSANRMYKAMAATYPIRTLQTCDWRSDFVSAEANFAWNEWTVTAGATTASGSGFLVGTVNLNRKVQSLGTKATGTWTLTASITFS